MKADRLGVAEAMLQQQANGHGPNPAEAQALALIDIGYTLRELLAHAKASDAERRAQIGSAIGKAFGGMNQMFGNVGIMVQPPPPQAMGLEEVEQFGLDQADGDLPPDPNAVCRCGHTALSHVQLDGPCLTCDDPTGCNAFCKELP